uniref:Putative conserved secreted protein n=1 Tax=Culex tarsalis TaxID=7177 RepID=A0A1Q3F3X4_CULTA
MKLFFVVTVLIFSILHCTSGYSRKIHNACNSNYPGQCYDDLTKTKVSLGCIRYTNCEKYTCSIGYTLTIEGCQLLEVPKGCYLTRDTGNKYPGCCPKVVC